MAINDVAIHRKVGERVADLAYALDGEEVGSVRCDGLVVATPAGSTGYNLANGGPVMAWGVEGFVVSFIAPHSLTARALVVAPDDRMTIYNRSREPLDVAVDGRPAGEIPPGGRIEARFVNDVGTIAQCRARRSTVACARSSVACIRAERPGRSGHARAVTLGHGAWSAGPVRCIEAMNSSSWTLEKRRWPPGRPVAVDVAGVGPAPDGGQRDTQVAGRLGAREDELALVAWLGGRRGEGHLLTSIGWGRFMFRQLRRGT